MRRPLVEVLTGTRPAASNNIVWVGFQSLVLGRMTEHHIRSEVSAFLSVFGTTRNLQARHSIAPTTTIDAVRAGHPRRERVATFNARAAMNGALKPNRVVAGRQARRPFRYPGVSGLRPSLVRVVGIEPTLP